MCLCFNLLVTACAQYWWRYYNARSKMKNYDVTKYDSLFHPTSISNINWQHIFFNLFAVPNIKIDVFPATYSRPSPLCKKTKYAKSMENENNLVPEMHQLTSGTGKATADTKLGISKSSMDAEDILVIGQVSTQSSNRSSPHHRPSKIFFSISSLWRLVGKG